MSASKIDLSDNEFTFRLFSKQCGDDTYLLSYDGANASAHPLVDKEKVLADLQRLIVIIADVEELVIAKAYDAVIERFTYKLVTIDALKKHLSSINMKGWHNKECGRSSKWVHQTAWEILSERNNMDRFKVDGMAFYSENPNIFSTFNGWKWKKVETVDKDIIKQWEDYVLHVISNDDDKLAKRIHQWIAYPLQNPGKRNCVALFISGKQGCGKTVFSDMIGELYNGYSLPNINNPDIILGRFNDSRENQAIIVLNEASSSDSGYRNKLDMDAIKAPITDRVFQLESKGMKPRQVINTNNFIITTNHQDSLRLTGDDRRFQVIEASDKYIKNTDIMEPFWSSNWNDELFNNIFTYYITMDLKDYEPTTIIETKARDDVLELSVSPYELFVREQAFNLKNGVICDTLFDRYMEFCEHANFKAYSINVFRRNIKEFCNHKQLSKGGIRNYYYTLKDEYIKRFAEEADTEEDADDI